MTGDPSGYELARRPLTGGYADEPKLRHQPVALVDLLDRVLAGGVVVAGEVTLSIADIDMVTISVRALVSSVSTLAAQGAIGSSTQSGSS